MKKILTTVLSLLALSLPLTLPSAAPVDHAFVRGAPTPKGVRGLPVNVMPIVFTDNELPGMLQKFPGGTVDVVMQQCFSGAFGPYLDKTPPKDNWTFASACKGSEKSVELNGINMANSTGYLDDFTRAWREDAHLYSGSGMKTHFDTALNDRAAQAMPAIAKILRDPYAPPERTLPGINVAGFKLRVVNGKLNGNAGSYVFVEGPVPGVLNGPTLGWVSVVRVGAFWQVKPGDPGRGQLLPNINYQVINTKIGGRENPQYTSAGAGSDNRSLALPNPNTNSVKQYAILAQWDKPDNARFAADIARMNHTLRNVYGVPADNIVVLYYTGRYSDGNAELPSFTLSPAPNATVVETLDAVTIDKPTGVNGNGPDLVFQDHAIKGDLFKVNGAPGGNIPDENARLLFYSTGHGAHAVGNVRLRYRNNNYKLLLSCAGTDGAIPGVVGFDPEAEFAQALESSLLSANFSGDLTNLLTDPNNNLDVFSDPLDQIQISTSQPIPPGVQLVINGYSDPAWYPLSPVADPNAVLLDLDPIVPGLLTNTYTYQVAVPNMILYMNPSSSGATDQNIDLSLSGLGPAAFDPGLIQAVIVRGSDQEVAYVPPDLTTATNLTAQDLGGGLLLTWPAGLTNYVIQQNPDLTTQNWTTVLNPVTLQPETTGLPDPNLPMGENWAYFPFDAPQMFFRLHQP